MRYIRKFSSSTQSTHRCTKCNNPPINGRCSNFIMLFDLALKLPLCCKYTVSKKKGATDFFAVTFTNIDGFL